MDFREQPLGRGMEFFVGIVLLFFVLAFITLISFIALNGAWSYAKMSLIVAFGLLSFWLGKLGYRLVFNKPRKNGGLLSNKGLKFGSIFFGVSSISIIILFPTHHNIVSVLSAICMLVACLYGWQISKERSDKET